MSKSQHNHLLMTRKELGQKINGSSHRAASVITQSKECSKIPKNKSLSSQVLKDSSKGSFSSSQIETAWSKAISKRGEYKW